MSVLSFIAKPVSMYFFAKKAGQLGLENIKDIELLQSTFFHLYKSKQRNFLFDKTGTLENHKSEYSLREGCPASWSIYTIVR